MSKMFDLSGLMLLSFFYFLSEQQQLSLITPRRFLNHFFFILKVAEVEFTSNSLRHPVSTGMFAHNKPSGSSL